MPALEARGIVKAFPGIVANDEVDFDLRSGEIHALLGENGAGKSTLMNILAGLYRPDAGEILLDGTPVAFRSPRDAIAAGLGMVHQHFTLVPSQTVTENILLGLDQPRFRLNIGRSEAEVARLADQFGMRVDPRAKIWQLSVGEQQRVEILKLLYRGARILIMDEPTAVLAPQEVDELFRTLHSMAADGRSVVFISHKLGEVLAIADRITVMRRGVVTAAGIFPRETSTTDLARRMVGRDVLETIQRAPQRAGATVLAVSDVTAENDRGLPALRGVSLDVAAGEIVGIAAVAGNGQSELAQVITGLRACGGSVTVNGEEVANRPAGHAIRHGVAHVPEDRTGVGSVAEPVDRRQPDHEALPRRARRSWLVHRRRRGAGAGPGAQGRVRDRRSVDRHPGPPSVGWQPPAPDHRPRDRVRTTPDGGRPADPWPRRRRHRGGPPRAARPARGRHRDPAHLGGPRRDPRPGRSDRRPVRGPDGRLVRGRRRGHPRDRAADDRWRSREPDAGPAARG